MSNISIEKVSFMTWPVVEEEQKCGHGTITKGQERDGRSAGRRRGVKYMTYCEQGPHVFQLLQVMGLGIKVKRVVSESRNSWETRNILQRWGLQSMCLSLLCWVERWQQVQGTLWTSLPVREDIFPQMWELKSGTDLKFSAGMICRNAYFPKLKLCLKILTPFPAPPPRGLKWRFSSLVLQLHCRGSGIPDSVPPLWLDWGNKQEVWELLKGI